MKTIIYITIAIIAATTIYNTKAQVTIGSLSDPRATLDIVGDPTSTTSKDGIIIPAMSGDQLHAKIQAKTYTTSTPVGTLIYLTSGYTGTNPHLSKAQNEGFHYWNGQHWEPLATITNLEDNDKEDNDKTTGNEITDTINGRGLTRTGNGTTASPYKIGIQEGTDGKLIIWESDTIAWQPYLKGQFNIGTNEPPIVGALLQLKTITDAASAGNENSRQGIALPRVALITDTLLTPMYDIQQSKDLPQATKLSHRGLTVYNTTTNQENNLTPGITFWDGSRWIPLRKEEQEALFTIDCNTIQAHGTYGNGQPLDNTNYIKISNLIVTRPGKYTITATTQPDNGYYFQQTGTFYNAGTYPLSIPGAGLPIQSQIDNITIKISGDDQTCNLQIPVRDMTTPRNFTIDCSQTTVEGMYFEDQQLNTNPQHGIHRIKITLKVDPEAIGSTAEITSNTVDGIHFSGNALLTSYPTQDIHITGFGTPRGLHDKTLTLTTNSQKTNASCDVTLHMLIPRKRLMTLGNSDNTYGYNPGLVTQRNPPNSLNTMLTDKDNFGYNQWSILRFAGFNNNGTIPEANFIPSTTPDSWVDDNRDIIALKTETWQNLSPEKLEQLLQGTGNQPKIDIFMIGYNTDYCRNNSIADQNRCRKLINYLKAGGILMICSEESESNANFMNLLFNNPSPSINSAGSAPAGSHYYLGYDNTNSDSRIKPYYCKDNDPILQGPFGDITGQIWGEDASITQYLTNLPLDDIIIYSGARYIGNTTLPATGVTIFRHRELPFVFVGDGGFNSAEARTYWNYPSPYCPFVLTTKTINNRQYNNYPSYRLNFGTTGTRVYNAVFTANAFAWCIYKSEEHRRKNR
jgi:hypothetical protein